jgi:hypothetical protein
MGSRDPGGSEARSARDRAVGELDRAGVVPLHDLLVTLRDRHELAVDLLRAGSREELLERPGGPESPRARVELVELEECRERVRVLVRRGPEELPGAVAVAGVGEDPARLEEHRLVARSLEGAGDGLLNLGDRSAESELGAGVGEELPGPLDREGALELRVRAADLDVLEADLDRGADGQHEGDGDARDERGVPADEPPRAPERTLPVDRDGSPLEVGRDVGGEGAGVLVASLALGRERPGGDRIELERHGAVTLAQPREGAAHRRREELDARLARHGRLAREDLGQDRSEGEDVGAAVQVLALRLLGRDVAERAEHGALAREPGVDALRVPRPGLLGEETPARSGVALEDPRDPPVHDEDLAERSEHDVRGLEVAVDDAAAVSVGDGLAHLDERSEKLVDGRPLRLVPEDRAERAPGDVAHQDERLAARRPPGVEDGRDPGVFEAGRHDRLAEEPAHAGVARVALYDLERGVAAEALVEDEVDDPHAALPEEGLARERDLGERREEGVRFQRLADRSRGLGALVGNGRHLPETVRLGPGAPG